jgi:protein-S-isoprenylcysteine O-methyltransferase Ste14
MARIFSFAFGFVSYLVFLIAFLYAMGFVLGMNVPKTINSGPEVPWPEAVAIDLVLLSLFAIQHSGMARKPFKRWMTRIVPVAIERSVYVLLTSLILIVIFWQWRPINGVVWQVDHPQGAMALTAVALLGWMLVLVSTFMINHFELFGLSQVVRNLLGKPTPEARFKTPGLYKHVRHPIYLGFIIAFWATPTMTVGHLLFAAVTTAYIMVGIVLEERDLVNQFGDQYRAYRRRVSMLLPLHLRRSELRDVADA